MWDLEKAMVPYSSPLAWKIPWAEEPGRLQSMGSQRVRHDWATSLSRIEEGNGNPLQCSCLENPRDGGAWWAAVLGVAQSRTRLKWLSSSSTSVGLGRVDCCLERFAAAFLFCSSAVRNGLVLPHFFHLLPGSRTYLDFQNLGGQLQGSSSHHSLLTFNVVTLLIFLQYRLC